MAALSLSPLAHWFVSMTSLCLTAAPDCRTGQSRGRYHARAASFPVVVVGWDYHAFLEMANSELKTDSLHEYIQYTVCSKYVWMYSLDLQKCHILLPLYWIFKFLLHHLQLHTAVKEYIGSLWRRYKMSISTVGQENLNFWFLEANRSPKLWIWLGFAFKKY